MDQEMSAFDRYERGLVLKQVRMFLGFLFGKVECPHCFCFLRCPSNPGQLRMTPLFDPFVISHILN